MKNIKNYLKLMRVKHYLKNLLIIFPLIFSGEIINLSKTLTGLLAFIAFSLTASAIYIINDMKDIESDRKHPIKKNRPLASGAVSKREGEILIAILLFLSIFIEVALYLIFHVNIFLAIIYKLIYICINVAYSFGLKNKPIADIVILMLGFLIRVLYGSCITDISVSNWLYLTVITASFYMGLGKRRNEIIKNGEKSRKVLKVYTKDFLEKNMYTFLAVTMVFYSLWCVDSTTIERVGNNYMIWTVPIVMIILLKYNLQIEKDSYGDPVDVLLENKTLLALTSIFAIAIISIIYFL